MQTKGYGTSKYVHGIRYGHKESEVATSDAPHLMGQDEYATQFCNHMSIHFSMVHNFQNKFDYTKNLC